MIVARYLNLGLVVVTALQLIAAKPAEEQTCMGGGLSRANPEIKMAAKGFADKAIRDNKVVGFGVCAGSAYSVPGS